MVADHTMFTLDWPHDTSNNADCKSHTQDTVYAETTMIGTPMWC